MAYPITLDSFTDPQGGKTLSFYPHSQIEIDQNNALRALEANIGVTGSAVATTIDYLLKSTSSLNPGHKHSYASWAGTFPTSGLAGTIPGSTITGAVPNVTYGASSIPASALYGVVPTTAITFSASSIPSSAITGVLPAGVLVFTSGNTSKSLADASTTQNIPHGLGVIPKYIRLNISSSTGWSGTSGGGGTATYNGTTSSVVGEMISNATPQTINSSGNIKLYDGTATSAFQIGVITFDASNIIITWTKTNSPTGTFNILWEAQA